MKKMVSLRALTVLIASCGAITFCAITLYNKINPHVIIVNNPGAGRFGDQIVGYGKAKYLSLKYNIPLRVLPFQYSEALKVSDEINYKSWSYFLNRAFYKIFGNVVWVFTEQDLIDGLAHLKGPTRFIAHINTRLNEHVKAKSGLDRYENSWVVSLLHELTINDPDFGNHLKNILQPVTPLSQVQLPTDRTTVAVHVRKGGGFHADPLLLSEQYYDHDYSDMVNYEHFYMNHDNPHLLDDSLRNIPTFDYDVNARDSGDRIYADKFPPEQFYVDQIKNLSGLLNDAPLYVSIFTDDTDPVGLMKRMEEKVGKKNIVFTCRTSKNTHDTNVLDDWYAMASFDCLIRSGSLFSYTSQLVGNHKIIFYPLHLKWVNDTTLLVDKVGVVVRDKELFTKKLNKII